MGGDVLLSACKLQSMGKTETTSPVSFEMHSGWGQYQSQMCGAQLLHLKVPLRSPTPFRAEKQAQHKASFLGRGRNSVVECKQKV